MELTNYTASPLSELKEKIAEAKYDSSYLLQAAFETVEQVTQGESMLLDASSPAVMILEMAAVQTAACVEENLALLRKQYPVLAVTEDELYHHMSDEDYLNRFAKPAEGEITFAFLFQDITQRGVWSEEERAYKLLIPRDTVVTVDGVSFMTLYPIAIRRYENGSVQVSYEPNIASPLMVLKNTIIDYIVRQGTEQESWLFFTVKVRQLSVVTEYFVLDKTYRFQKTIVHNDAFYAARVFYNNASTSGNWVEVKTTHTDQVFDIETPTVSLRVVEGQLIVSVPVIYQTTGLLSGSLRVDVYTTKGPISMNLQNYRPDNFVVNMKAIDEVRDLNDFTRALGEVSFYALSRQQIVGGEKAVDFDTLRDRVIENSVGSQVLPITNVQLQAEVENAGFEILKNVDVLTNRIFLATRALPMPSNPRLVTAANIGIVSYAETLQNMKAHDRVVDNGERITLQSKTLFISENGILRLVTKAERDQLAAMNQTSMVAQINNRQYLYTPFYYVLDASQDEFELRAYALDQPYAKDLNFVRQNQTLQLFVNTASFSFEKTPQGFSLRILTKSGNFYKQVENSQVGVQLAFSPVNETSMVYINGVLESVREDGERIYRFDLETRHDITPSGLIGITNAKAQGVESYTAWIHLETEINLLHHTNSLTQSFYPDTTDNLIGKFNLPSGSVGNSHERLTLHLGDALSNLWTRSRSYKLDTVYRRHPVDVPLYYEATVYDVDPETGVFFDIDGDGVWTDRVIHEAGTPVLDVDGHPVFKHRAGDIMLDDAGNPIEDTVSTIGREVDLLVVDGRYLYATDAASTSYRQEIEATLTTWITENVSVFEDRLLEQTRIYFYPKTTVDFVQVYTENGGVDYIPAEQTFTVRLYVSQSIYSDTDIREKLRASTIQVVDNYVGQNTVNMNELSDALRLIYGRSVAAFNLSGLGGAKNYQILRLVSERNKLSLKKELTIQADKSMIVQDAINVEFFVAS